MANKNTLEGKLPDIVKQRIDKYKKANFVLLTLDGHVYSSKQGYLGEAEKRPEVDIFQDKTKTSSIVKISSYSDPTPSEINGGTTGAFERRQLDYDGFDGIRADLTLPLVSNLGSGEQPWIYYGFETTSYGIEGGYSYQTGNPRWRPFIRNDDYDYGLEDYTKYDGDKISNLKFYVKKNTSDNKYYAYLIAGATQVVTVAETKFTSLENLSVKRNTTIARAGFDGQNIQGKSENQKWENVIVSKYNSDYYYSWDNYNEYSYWNGSKWYGTIDCTSNYIHRSNGYTSIYNQ